MRLTDEQIELYSRQIILREVGGTGQSVLRAARVLVGGTSPAAEICLSYLLGAGVGTVATAQPSAPARSARGLLPLPPPGLRTADAPRALLDAADAGATPYDVVLDLGSGDAGGTERDASPDPRLGWIALRADRGALHLFLLPHGSGCPACAVRAGAPLGTAPTSPGAIASASAGALAALACCDWLLGIGEQTTARVLALAAGSSIWMEEASPARIACPRGCPPSAHPV